VVGETHPLIPVHVASESASNRLSIIYDGDCPFCASYVKLYAVLEKVEEVELISARERPDLVLELRAKGMEINEGMVVIWQEHYYYGADAMHLLSILGSGTGIFGVLNRLLSHHRNMAAAAYPLLAIGRRLVLSLLGRKPIPHSD
jgi:predicted DCC family thiol-disulfide oxidoreductase YuxK